MGISFSFKNNAQYVKLEGTLSTVEEAAVRLKIDQKINQGRNKILIDITHFTVSDRESLTGLHSILKYTSLRGTATGLFGMKQTSWLPIAENFPGKLNLFETESEALKWIETIEVKPPTEEKKDPEAEFKEKKVRELLAKYEIYQARNDYDPYMLKKLEQEYAREPQREALFALRRAYKHLDTLRDAIDILEANCRKIADQLLESTTIRKIPLSPAELAVKTKALLESRNVVEAEVNEVKQNIDQNMGIAVEFRKKSQDAELHWKNQLDSIQKQIDAQTLENQKLLDQLKAP